MKALEFTTPAVEALIDLTSEIRTEIAASGVENGICIIYCPHTTAGLTINENADPTVKEDLLMSLERIVPYTLPFRHSEGNSPAHVKASLLGSSVFLIIKEGRPVLGTWQGVFLGEFDGPRKRKVFLEILEK